jgi:CheY-like chemotaxis protein
MSDGARDKTRPVAKRHIFAVNTAPAVLELVRQFLEGEGYTVTATTVLSGALVQIDALQPDLLIIDIPVEEPMAWELWGRLQADAGTRDLPMIVVSTSQRLLDEARALATGWRPRRFLAKPFDLEALLAQVEELIGRA